MNEKFLHCLRVAVTPDENVEKRTQNIIRHCKKYGFGNVMLFINAEEFNYGHMTVKEAKPWLNVIKNVSEKLKQEGISVGLNPWITIGHLDRGRKLKPGQNFTTMVDADGRKADLVACPLDEEWRKYYAEYLTYLIEEVKPDTVWIEDDFRIHNHAPLKYGGCFCPLHMKKFNEKLGANYTRDEFAKKATAEGEPGKERICLLEVQRETMNDFSRFLGETIRKCGKDVKIGLMSSAPQMHCTENRDWKTIHKNLAQGNVMINRIHLPCYFETTGKDYCYNFNRISMVVRALIPDETKIYPETENGTFSVFAKDPDFLRFQVEAAIPLNLSGMTYSIYGFVGNGAVDGYGYGKEIKRITPYLQAVKDLNFKFSSLEGVIVPVDEQICLKKENGVFPQGTTPNGFNACAFLTATGINCKPTTEREFKNKIVAMFGDTADGFDDEELKRLAKDNFILYDGGAVLKLKKRGLLSLINATDAKDYLPDDGFAAYEEAEKGIKVFGIDSFRASSQEKAGVYVRVTYNKRPVIYTTVHAHDFSVFGEGFARGENFGVFPYICDDLYTEQLSDLRKTALVKMLSEARTETKLVVTDKTSVAPYLYDESGRKILILVNATESPLMKIDLTLKGINVKNAFYLDKKTGEKKRAEFKITPREISIKRRLNRLSTETFIFE